MRKPNLFAMKVLFISSVLLMTLIAAPVLAQDPDDFYGRNVPQSQGGNLEEEYTNVLTNIAEGEVAAAQKILEQIKKDAKARGNKDMQNKAQATLRRTWDLYSPFFRMVEDGKKNLQGNQPKTAQDAFEKARALAQKQKASDIPELQAIDRGLAAYIDNYVSAANEQRTAYLQQRIEAGRAQLQYRDYEGAIQILEDAEKQIYPERKEAETMGLTSLLDQAEYGRLFTDAGRLAQEGNYPEALKVYEQAQAKNDNPEIRLQIDLTRNKYQEQLLDQTEAAIGQGDHQQALKLLDQASELGPSQRLNAIRANTHRLLREQGDRLAGSGDYRAALEAYETSLEYQDDPALRQQLQTTQNKLAHDQDVQKAKENIDKGNISLARKYLERAAEREQSPIVSEEIRRIDTYYQHINSGKDLLKGNPVDAYQQFKEAQKLYDTKEVQRLIKKAEKKAGPALSPVEAADFYQG